MRKFLTLLLAVLMVASLAACGNEPAANDAPKSTDFTRGVWTDNCYTNEFLNLKLTMPEGWVYASDEELAELMGVITQNSSNLSEEFINAKVIFDMMAQDPANGTSITLQVENMALTVGGSKITEKEYLDLTLSQIEQQGITCTLSDGVTETTIGDVTYQTYDSTLNDGVLSQRYLISMVGKYMVFITISCVPSVTNADSIMPMLSANK